MSQAERDTLAAVTTEWSTARQIHGRMKYWSPVTATHILRRWWKAGIHVDCRRVPYLGGEVAEYRLKTATARDGERLGASAPKHSPEYQPR